MNDVSIDIIFKKLLAKKDLNLVESNFLVKKIFSSDFNSNQLSSILTLLFQKKECFEEIFAFSQYLKSRCKKINVNGDFMDTCGTGGDKKGSFNISTATSILLSTFDIKISKHGNRSVTSKSGSFDVLEALNIKIRKEQNHHKKNLKKNNICFLFAPYFHEILKNVADIRKSLPFRTIFNLLGPLLNPIDLKFQLMGVSDKINLETHARCLSKLNLKKAWVVYNEKGYDELTTTSKNYFIEIKKDKVSKINILEPQKLGFKIRKEQELKGGTPQENAFIMKRLFEGESGAIRDNVILNSAAGLMICNKAKHIEDGIKMASTNLDNGSGLKKLNDLINS